MFICYTKVHAIQGKQKSGGKVDSWLSQGLISRLYETFLVLMLVAALLFGMTFLLSAILDYGRASIHSLFALWRGYLPFLYSCLSCFGVMLLLSEYCT
ncbi:hypothetical protein V5799_025412 [Amblyomma americanum]|uniref:Uncharacterized protein n=1 Tax=Amblyomma americanum TaxID=6943 RepID=A0AAQ4E9F6_AMBAM